jgi:hypothetical protein
MPAVRTLTVEPTDDRYTIRETLRRLDGDPTLIILPWDVEKGWDHPLDFELQVRTADHHQREIAWVIEDPVRRAVARDAGMPVFKSETAASDYLDAEGHFPEPKRPARPQQPNQPWWAPDPEKPKRRVLKKQPPWLIAIESVVLLLVMGAVAVAFALAVPSASVTLRPRGVTYTRTIPIAVDATAEEPDLQRGIVPSTRIGETFTANAQVATTGQGYSFSGLASGTVLFTNLLGQAYTVPAGTIVRTSSGSYPVRYETVQEVSVPPFGQAQAEVQALNEGPQGNVAAYQINRVEGVAGFAVRVTNPQPITGAESQTVAIVSTEDRARAQRIATEQVMGKAFNGLQTLAAQEPGRFLPNQTLVVQATPRIAYTHLVGERTDTLGLTLELLITGEAVDIADAHAVAFRALVTRLPAGYTLSDAWFEYGEAAEEDIAPGDFSFFVTGHAYATAKIDETQAVESILGESPSAAEEILAERYPLAEPPEITVTPSWFPTLPFIPLRVQVEVNQGSMNAPGITHSQNEPSP